MATACCAIVLLVTAAAAKDKIKPVSQKPGCARASYPGDPVCDVGESVGILPTPSSRVIRPGESRGFRVNDEMSVRGRSDFNENRYGGTILNNPNPNPRGMDVNGGGGVDYKF